MTTALLRLMNKFKNITVLLFFSTSFAFAQGLSDFQSDGCSQFPDGTFSDQDLWCECCIIHDLAYWQGGTAEQKHQADLALSHCVAKKTGDELLARTMYLGVTLGGSAYYLTWYRWGYGWPYGRGYKALTAIEQRQVVNKLEKYRDSGTAQSCDFEHPLKSTIKSEFQRLID